MVGKIEKTPQLNLFETPLVSFINVKHELCVLASEIDWESVEKDFAGYYADFGRPSIPIRKIVGLALLKQIYNLSDEALIDRWIENPYWQYFCGEHTFQKGKPMDPSEFVYFRKRIGAEGAEMLLRLSVKLFGAEACERKVLIDSTVTRPKKSLHFSIHNPVSNLHFSFNPKYSLQFLNPSLWSGT